jgi:CPA2 family monovalent cation:H+ antiporter-2
VPTHGDAAGAAVGLLFIELGAAIAGLAVLARVANHWGISSIPLFLLAGLAFGNGGLLPLDISQNFIHIGAEIGVILLLFMLGLEHSAEELVGKLRDGVADGLVDAALNFTPGLLLGLILGWNPLAAVVLGGVTYISSSGVIAKVLAELKWNANPETPAVVSVLVIEDLVMAVYLPIVAALLIGHGFVGGVSAVAAALIAVGLVLVAAARCGGRISRWVAHEADDIILLTVFGVVLLVAGVAQRLQISAAVGAFLVGVALSGPLVSRTRQLVAPLRDLFASVFFFFFGLQIDPFAIPPVLLLAASLAALTVLSKLATGWWIAARGGLPRRARLRAGALLAARGEFSIVIAGLGVGASLEPQLGPLAAAYVLLTAMAAPILARVVGQGTPARPHDSA